MSAKDKNIAEEEWFQGSPMGLMVLDAEQKISAVNPVLETMLGLPSTKLCGQDSNSIPDEGLRVLFNGSEKLHVTGPAQDCWLQRRVQPLTEQDGAKLALHIFQDVTEFKRLQEENQRLRQQVEELAITDELTGLANQRALSQMLTAQVTRSRRYQNPLSLVMVEVDALGAEAGQAPSKDLVLAISHYLRDRLRWADVIGRWDECQFVLMLPETPGSAAQTLLEKISGDVPSIGACKGHDSGFQLRFGLVEWRKGLDTRKMIEQLKQMLTSEEAIIVSCGG